MVKAVIFDFYNTLAETRQFGPSWEELVAELGYALPADVRDRWWNDGIDGTEHDEHSVSRDHYVAWQQSRVRSMLAECSMPAAVQDVFIERVREISGHNRIDRYDEVDGVLRGLREQGIALAICSNWDWDLHDAVDSAGLTGAFDVVVSSAPQDALFVGDTWTCDVAGPRAAGMRAVYVRRTHLGVDHTAPEPHPSEHGDHDDHDAHVHHAIDLRAVEALGSDQP